VAYSTWGVLITVPLTTNTSAFFFGNGLFGIGLVTVLAIYGCVVSLGDQHLLANNTAGKIARS
jgi:hypothetical protein